MAWAYSIFVFLFALWSTLLSIVSAVPDLGIQRDYAAQFPHDSLMSYSGVIEFKDKTIPGDKSKMSDAQFINLAKVAYDAMIDIWGRSNFKSEACPGAMMAMESEGFVYFASAIRALSGINFNAVDEGIPESIGWFQRQCVIEGMGSHRNGGRCAEPNGLRLYGDKNGLTDDNPPKYKNPPTTNNNPRIAVWGRPSQALPRDTPGTYFPPCADASTSSYGCVRFVNRYGLKAVTRQNPDANGEDGWEFTKVPVRSACAPPPPAPAPDPGPAPPERMVRARL